MEINRIPNSGIDDAPQYVGKHPITLEEMNITEWLNRPNPDNFVVKFRNDFLLLNFKELSEYDFKENVVNCYDSSDDTIYYNLGEYGIPDICVTDVNWFDVLFGDNFDRESRVYIHKKFELVDSSKKIKITTDPEKCKNVTEINIGELVPMNEFLGGKRKLKKRFGSKQNTKKRLRNKQKNKTKKQSGSKQKNKTKKQSKSKN
jgi:hypothetical protein